MTDLITRLQKIAASVSEDERVTILEAVEALRVHNTVFKEISSRLANDLFYLESNKRASP